MLSNAESWTRVGVTATASILGSLMIYVDLIWNKISNRQFSILHSHRFIGAALSLSCGTLIVTVFVALLPESTSSMMEGHPKLHQNQANGLLIPFFAIGIILCQFMNFVVLRFTSRSVVHCSHDLDNATRSRKSISPEPCEESPLLGPVEHNEASNDQIVTGTSAHEMSATHSHSHGSGNDQSHHHHHHHHHHPHTTSGYSSAPFSVPINRIHHHHDSQFDSIKSGRGADLLSIGLQTTLGISIHRVPEGLLLFATSRTDRQLGISIVLALSLHSFSEGFSIAAPLYGALHRRGMVLLISILLGCVPQIVGAFIGSVIFREGSDLSGNSKFVFGACLAATAGFMLVVCIQMAGSAFRYMSQTPVLYGVIAGVLISLAARAI